MQVVQMSREEIYQLPFAERDNIIKLVRRCPCSVSLRCWMCLTVCVSESDARGTHVDQLHAARMFIEICTLHLHSKPLRRVREVWTLRPQAQCSD